MPRFVILLHECPPDYDRPTHYDLMLEDGATLRTWALERAPDIESTIDAELLGDHRLAYLDYEGKLSDGRGIVSQWDRGTFEWRLDTNEAVEVLLNGERLQSTLRLSPTDAAQHRPQRWRVVVLSG